jgi:hypothetical protein
MSASPDASQRQPMPHQGTEEILPLVIADLQMKNKPLSDYEQLKAALLKTQALAIRLEARLIKAEEEIETLKREAHVEKYASSF